MPAPARQKALPLEALNIRTNDPSRRKGPIAMLDGKTSTIPYGLDVVTIDDHANHPHLLEATHRVIFWINGAPEKRPGGPYWHEDFSSETLARHFIDGTKSSWHDWRLIKLV